jgi:hypothetical protein
VSELLTAGFPSPSLLAYAADMLPAVDPVLREGPSFRVDVTAGVVQLVARDLAKQERTLNRVADRRVTFGEDQDRVGVPSRPSRAVIDRWSSKSRGNLIRLVASSDWRPMMRDGVPVMVTLTYPGDWSSWAPDGAAVKRHLERFKEMWRKEFGRPRGLWKLEFQRRGAPHVHLLLPMPHGLTLTAFRGWVAWHWNRAVMLDDLGSSAWWVVADRADHLRAGTAVDLQEGMRCRDPKRIAVYFLKHSSKTKDGKEYQHVVPARYRVQGAGPGRFWGFWGVDQPGVSVYVSVRHFVALRRLLRRYAKANGRTVAQGGRLSGLFLCVNDGPGFLSALARALAVLDECDE